MLKNIVLNWNHKRNKLWILKFCHLSFCSVFVLNLSRFKLLNASWKTSAWNMKALNWLYFYVFEIMDRCAMRLTRAVKDCNYDCKFEGDWRLDKISSCKYSSLCKHIAWCRFSLCNHFRLYLRFSYPRDCYANRRTILS